MGLLDCVSDKRHPGVSPRGDIPLTRGDNMSSRRSLGSRSLFSSNANIKGKDIDFWRQRVLRFIFQSEGREDVRDLRMPLRQLGYSAIGDFIRDIPAEIYEPYQKQSNPGLGLRKNDKVIWERDGIAEPGMFKWEGTIEGRRCMGLQLDRKKAVPFNCYDGKGLFYCKPGHRALVPVEEVFPYKNFLRQFLGLPPRKDSMPLNLLPGRSSVRLTVAKKYTPGDRVHLPNENKWATILWTGKIDGEWVVDLVYDPDKPATGRMASPDEPCMSRSLSMADFIDQLGSPPKHVPTPPPLSPDIEDDVFEQHDEEDIDEIPQVINQDDGLRPQPKASESDISESDDSLSEADSHSESEQSVEEPAPEVDSATDSDSEVGGNFRRTYSEPVPDIKKSPEPKRQELKGLEVFETQPLQSRSTHKPLFNLASFGSNKKKKEKPIKVSPIEVERVSSSPPKKEFSFFSKNKAKRNSKPKVVMVQEPKKIMVDLDEPLRIPEKSNSDFKETNERPSPKGIPKEAKGPLDFFRRDRSRSPINRKPDRKFRTSSGDHREVPIDVPQSMRSPIHKEPPLAVPNPPRQKSSSDIEDFSKSPPPCVEIRSSPVVRRRSTPIPSEQSTSEESSDEDYERVERSIEKEPETKKDAHVEVEVEVQVNNQQSVPQDDSDHESYSSVSSPPYSPAIKDVGFKMSKPVAKSEDKKSKSSTLKSFGSYFSPKRKTLPPKDYAGPEEAKPQPPVRKESLEKHDSSEDEDSITSVDDSTPKVPLEHNVLEDEAKPRRKTSLRRSQGGMFSKKKPKKTSVEIPAVQPQRTKSRGISSPLPQQVFPEPLGDQDGLILDLLKVKDDHVASATAQPHSVEQNTPKRKGKPGKTFSFGFSKKPKSSTSEATSETLVPPENKENVESYLGRMEKQNQSISSVSSQEDIKETGPMSPTKEVLKPKKNSLKDSFSRTFSFTKSKRKGSIDTYEKLEEFSEEKKELPRPISLYIDNNEAIGATRITRPKSKSTSVLVDIQPWNERKGYKTDILDLDYTPTDESPRGDNPDAKTVVPVQPVPALIPKTPEPVVPDHRRFTTPRIFKWGQKSTEEPPKVKPPKPPAKPKKKTSFKGSKMPKSPPYVVMSPESETLQVEIPKVETPKVEILNVVPPNIETLKAEIIKVEPPKVEPLKFETQKAEILKVEPPKVKTPPPIIEELASPVSEPPPLPKTGPPKLPTSPPPITPRSPKSPKVISKEVVLPNLSNSLAPKLKSALKRRKEIESIPKGIKVGDRVIWYSGRIPIPGTVMKLYKDGTDKYTAVVKFDRESGKEPLSLIREGDAYIVTVEELITPEVFGIPSSAVSSPTSPSFPVVKYIPIEEESGDSRAQSVRFEPPTESVPPAVPEINVEPATPGSPKVEDHFDDDNNIPPPFQEEEVEIACGLRRGIPSRERACCLETLLFAMFYTTNTFDTSILYENGFEEDRLSRDVKTVLRHQIVHPLRQSGFCEWSAMKKLKNLMKSLDPDFNPSIIDAEIMTSILFERALKLGKFISYSTGVTDFLHQLVFDPRDLSKSSTIQQLLETSLEHMDNAKLRTIPTPALILEIPRANDKLVHYEAVVPNLSVMISHLLEDGPRLCICGVVAKYECPVCLQKYGAKSIAYCDSCKSMADQQVHFQLDHDPNLIQIAQQIVTMDLVSVICVQAGHYTAFVKCGSERMSPWLFYDAAEVDNPKVSLEHNLGMWIDRLEKYPGKYGDAFAHPLLTHFLANSHICIYQSREKSSLV